MPKTWGAALGPSTAAIALSSKGFFFYYFIFITVVGLRTWRHGNGGGAHLNTQIFVSRGHPGLWQDEPRPLATVAGTRGRSGGRAPLSKRDKPDG